MKNIFLISIIFGLFMWSCGSAEKSESEDTKDNQQVSEFVTAKGLVKAKLPEGWTKDGKGENGFKIYSSLMSDNTDMHKAIKHDYGFPDIDQVKEVKVDDLPALTLKEKLMQNEAMIARSWLVYNGSKIIKIVVQSPETNWDDAVAEKVISTVKITDREASVTMPKPVGNPLFEKPDNFPEEVIGIFKENFNNTPVLSVEAIENSIAINATIQKDIKDSEFSDDKKRLLLDSIVKANGFEALEDYIKIPAVTETCFKVIKVHKDFENMEKDSEEYKISRNLISSIIDQVKIAEEDVRFVYDNWDLSKECLKKILKDY